MTHEAHIESSIWAYHPWEISRVRVSITTRAIFQVDFVMSLYASLGVSPRKKRVCTSSDDEATPKRRRLAYVPVSLPAPRSHPAQATYTPSFRAQTPPFIAFPPRPSRKHTLRSPARSLPCPRHLRSRPVRTDWYHSQCPQPPLYRHLHRVHHKV